MKRQKPEWETGTHNMDFWRALRFAYHRVAPGQFKLRVGIRRDAWPEAKYLVMEDFGDGTARIMVYPERRYYELFLLGDASAKDWRVIYPDEWVAQHLMGVPHCPVPMDETHPETFRLPRVDPLSIDGVC
jgi:hypothetical protein